MARTKARDRRQGGQTLVEFALILIPFLLITMGIFDFGRAILDYNMISNAAREGARVGIISTRTNAQICEAVITHVSLPGVSGTGCTSGGLTTTIVSRGSPPTLVANSGSPVVVRVQYVFTPITPLIGDIIGTSLTLTAQSSMYVEN